jgi:ribosomal protein S27E
MLNKKQAIESFMKLENRDIFLDKKGICNDCLNDMFFDSSSSKYYCPRCEK